MRNLQACHDNAGKVAADGKLRVLHNVERPADIPETCFPYTAWQLQALQDSNVYVTFVSQLQLSVPFPMPLFCRRDQKVQVLADLLVYSPRL